MVSDKKDKICTHHTSNGFQNQKIESLKAQQCLLSPKKKENVANIYLESHLSCLPNAVQTYHHNSVEPNDFW